MLDFSLKNIFAQSSAKDEISPSEAMQNRIQSLKALGKEDIVVEQSMQHYDAIYNNLVAEDNVSGRKAAMQAIDDYFMVPGYKGSGASSYNGVRADYVTAFSDTEKLQLYALGETANHVYGIIDDYDGKMASDYQRMFSAGEYSRSFSELKPIVGTSSEYFTSEELKSKFDDYMGDTHPYSNKDVFRGLGDPSVGIESNEQSSVQKGLGE